MAWGFDFLFIYGPRSTGAAGPGASRAGSGPFGSRCQSRLKESEPGIGDEGIVRRRMWGPGGGGHLASEPAGRRPQAKKNVASAVLAKSHSRSDFDRKSSRSRTKAIDAR